ncbi:MAG: hypothetical protein AAF555_12030 [Verrucomicrobiota bacterium]
MKPKVISMVSGLLWGLLPVYLLQERSTWGAVSDVRIVALLFAPLVGLFTYYTSRWVYRKKNGMKVLWSVVSVYLSAGLYGVILATLAKMNLENPSGEHAYEIVIAIWWGITLIPILWVIYPASFLNHLLVAKFENKERTSRDSQHLGKR